MEAISLIFNSPVIALGCFDSDVSFLSIYKDGTLSRYVCADEYVLEEFEFEEYSS